MDEFTLDFGPDPLSESEDESLDPFPPADDETNRAPIPVVLLSLDQGKFDAARSLDELAALAEANHMEAVATVTQSAVPLKRQPCWGKARLRKRVLSVRIPGQKPLFLMGNFPAARFETSPPRCRWRLSTVLC